VQEEEEGLIIVRIQPAQCPRQDLGEPATPVVIAVEASIESEGRVQISTVDETGSPQTRLPKPPRQGFDAGGQPVPLARKAVSPGVERSHHRHLRRRRVRCRSECAIEDEALPRELVDPGARLARITIDTQMIRAQGVEGDEHDFANRRQDLGRRFATTG